MQTIKYLYIIVSSFCLLIINIGTTFAQTTPSYVVKTVVIDAGHGGKDPGAVGKISQEKNLTLSIALKVGSFISANCPDVKVIYTRTTDEFIELHKRADIANHAKADLFISIHVNASTNSDAYGTDTWTMGLAKNEANLNVAKRENNVISLESDASKYQGMSANDNEAIILHQLQQGAFSGNSISFAEMIQNHLREDVGKKDRSVHQAPFLVLWRTAMPSVLIETGFITNAEEEKWLNNVENREELAYAIYTAFVDYKKYIENRSNGNVSPTQAQKTKETTQTKTQQSNTIKNKTTIETKPDTTNNSEFDIYYSIQIGAGKEKIETSPANFKGLSNVFCLEENGLYKYYYGKTATYKEITEILQETKKIYPSCFVTARDKNNKKLLVTEARNKTN